MNSPSLYVPSSPCRWQSLPSEKAIPSSPSRWHSLPGEKAALSNATNRFSHSRVSLNSTTGIVSSPTKKRGMQTVPTSIPLSYFHQQSSSTTSRAITSPDNSKDKSSSLLLLQVSPLRTLALSSPVQMPVRKNSFDRQPRQPTRYLGGDSTSSLQSSRSTTMSILDEALFVCDLCNEDDDMCSSSASEITNKKDASLGGGTRDECGSLFVDMMPNFPSLT